MKTNSTGELRLIVRGVAVLFVVACVFALGKVAFWKSTVVHEERSSIHRMFPGGVVVRFPQESVNAADLLTAASLGLGGAIALGIAFGMGERLRARRVTSASDARAVRAFFAFAGAGLVWLAIDEVFLVHEMLSANFLVDDNKILAVYAAIGGVACLAWNRVLRASWLGLGVLACGAGLHAGAMALDFLQHSIVWGPEEPLEMLAAGFYAIGIAAYFARFVLAGSGLPVAATKSGGAPAPAAQTIALDLPDSAIQPITTPEGARPDPAWIR